MTEIEFDLEDNFVGTLANLLQRDLDQEYEKPVVNKAKRQAGISQISLSVMGEEISGVCRDSKGSHKFSLTVPLFDDGGYSFARCSCQEDVYLGEGRRCHHLFLAESALHDYLSLQNETRPPDDWRNLFQCAVSTEKMATPLRRIEWRLDLDLTPTPYLQELKDDGWAGGRSLSWEKLAKMGPDWPDQMSQLCSGHIDIEQTALGVRYTPQIFDILCELCQSEAVFWGASRKPVSLRLGALGISAVGQGDGFLIQPQIGGRSYETLNFFEGRGLAGFEVDGGLIELAIIPNRWLKLFKSASEGNLKIPASDKADLFRYFQDLESDLEMDFEVSEDKCLPAQSVFWFRATPIASGGVGLELTVAPSKSGRRYFPGEGPERVIDLQDPSDPGVRIRDLGEERNESGHLCRKVGLGAPDRQEGFGWNLTHHETIEFLARASDVLTGDEAVNIEWPKEFEDKPKPYEVNKVDDSKVCFKVGKGSDWFDHKIEIEIDGEPLNWQELVSALRRKRGYVAMGKGRFLSLSEKLESLVSKAALASDDGQLTSEGIIDFARDSQGSGYSVVDNNSTLEGCLKRYDCASSLKLPSLDQVNATLRSYQIEGVEWLYRLFHWGSGACLADDMGLGKTLQSLSFISLVKHKGPCLIVCPASLVRNWIAEKERFCPSLNLIDWSQDRRGINPKSLGPNDAVIISYNLLLYEGDRLGGTSWVVKILDEAGAIKNPSSKTHQAVCSQASQFSLALSGTPIENNLGELWSLFHVMVPGLLGRQAGFKESFAKPIAGGDSDAVARLKAMIHPFMLRRMKKDHLSELPPKTEISMWVDLECDEKKLYETLRYEALEDLAEKEQEEGDSKMAVLAALSRLRMSVCHPSLVDPEWEGSASKLSQLVIMLDRLKQAGHKALVFSQYTRFLKLIMAALDKREINYCYLDGSLSHAERKSRVDSFQKGSFDVFLISLKAGGTGLNLTAADYVIHVDPWWNPAVEDQASDRAYRMGQTKPVTVYRMITRNSVEEKIMVLHRSKRHLATELLSGKTMDAGLDIETMKGLI